MATLSGTADDYFDLTAEEEALLCELDTQLLAQSIPAGLPTPNLSSTAKACYNANVLDAIVSGAPGAAVADKALAVVEESERPDEETGTSIHLGRGAPELAASPISSKKPNDRPPVGSVSSLFEDDRPPLLRFRTYPRKPFTVTDLTSGSAWCELQYFYTLTRLPGGRKTRTDVMKRGSTIHEKLEAEVHRTVTIDVVSREDAFALRLWNVVQGLRTLRETGLTRELEVWGTVDGHLVTGKIDGLSHECPDPALEAEVEGRTGEAAPASASPVASKDIREMFGQKVEAPKPLPRTYLCDVKTRGSAKPPYGASLLRPVKVQLFLYHRFLCDMAAGKLDFLRVLKRLNTDPDEPLTDGFLAQISSLHDEIFAGSPPDSSQSQYETAPSSPAETATQESTTTTTSSPQRPSDSDALKYRTIRELVALVRDEMGRTFPRGADSIGRIVSVDYRFRGDGSVIGTKTFAVDDAFLDDHVARDLEWWKGKRRPRGVDVEDAYKCRICEFADECSWRQGIDEENLKRAREKLEAKSRASS